MGERRLDRGVSVGVTSLAVIFTVIAMTVFAVLAYATAQSDARLAGEYARSVEAWWAADSAAEEVEAALRAQWESQASAQTVAETAQALGCETRLGSAGVTVELRSRVDDARTLRVCWEIGEAFTVAAWQTVPAGRAWQPDDTPELLS